MRSRRNPTQGQGGPGRILSASIGDLLVRIEVGPSAFGSFWLQYLLGWGPLELDSCCCQSRRNPTQPRRKRTNRAGMRSRTNPTQGSLGLGGILSASIGFLLGRIEVGHSAFDSFWLGCLLSWKPLGLDSCWSQSRRKEFLPS